MTVKLRTAQALVWGLMVLGATAGGLVMILGNQSKASETFWAEPEHGERSVAPVRVPPVVKSFEEAYPGEGPVEPERPDANSQDLRDAITQLQTHQDEQFKVRQARADRLLRRMDRANSRITPLRELPPGTTIEGWR